MVKHLKELILEESQNLVSTNEDWAWLKSKKIYKRKLFENTTLIINPNWVFSDWKASAQPTIRIESKLFDQIKKNCKIKLNLDPCEYHFQTHYTRDVFPLVVTIFQDQVPAIRPYNFSKEAIPDIVRKIFDLGNDIFNTEMDFSNEESLLKSLIFKPLDYDIPETTTYRKQISQLTVGAQAVLRLIFYADKDFTETALEKFKKYGGSHRTLIPQILPHMDEIIKMSPYI